MRSKLVETVSEAAAAGVLVTLDVMSPALRRGDGLEKAPLARCCCEREPWRGGGVAAV